MGELLETLTAIERYKKLNIKESLSISYTYPLACEELSVILRLAYLSKSPKPLQSLLFDHTLSAFRLLPSMQTQAAVSAANLLFQRAGAAFPKQKRVLATTEFKQAMVAHKRGAKFWKEIKVAQLSHDVLVHVFSFLDVQSMVSAGTVCRLWNAAANDQYLWFLQYTSHFDDSGRLLNYKVLQSGSPADNEQHRPASCVSIDLNLDWKSIFRKDYQGLPSIDKFNRAYCQFCDLIVWRSNLKCANEQHHRRNRLLEPVSASQIVRYVLDGTSLSRSSDSDSDSESDEEVNFKFWAFTGH